MKKLLEILELCKKLSKSTPQEQVEDKLYKLKDGTLSSVSKKSSIPELKTNVPSVPKIPEISMPSATRQKNKINNSDV